MQQILHLLHAITALQVIFGKILIRMNVFKLVQVEQILLILHTQNAVLHVKQNIQYQTLQLVEQLPILLLVTIVTLIIFGKIQQKQFV
jgi:hypothetical protein